MFYLETKDGDKFFTNKDSDDKQEFEKIIEDKLGKDAAELFDNLVTEDIENAGYYMSSIAYKFKEIINEFNNVLSKEPIDKLKLEQVLYDLENLYTDMVP